MKHRRLRQTSKVPRTRKRTVRYHDAQHVSAFRRVIFWFLVCGYVALCGWIFFLWDGTRITQIVVTGTQRVSQEQLTHAVESVLHGQIFNSISRAQYVFVHPDVISQAVRSVSGAIHNVTVTKRFPATVVVAVKEWSQVYLWCMERSNQCALLEDDGRLGRVVEPDDAIVRDNTVITIRDRGTQQVTAFGPTSLTPQFLAQLSTAFADAGMPLIMDTIMTPHRQAEEITVMTQEGWYVTLRTTQPVYATVRAVMSVLQHGMSSQERENLVAVDARLIRKVFYRTKENATQSAATVVKEDVE